MKNTIKKILEERKTKKKKGFTLIELLAVLVLLAIIMTITISTIFGNVKKAKESAFDTVGKTMVKYLKDNYNNCMLGDKNIATYDEELFDSNCKLIDNNLSQLSDTLITNSGYNTKDIESVDIRDIGKGKFGVVVHPSSTGQYSSFSSSTDGVYKDECWTMEPIEENNYKLVKFNGFDYNANNVKDECKDFVTKDESDGLYSVTIPSTYSGKSITTLDNSIFYKKSWEEISEISSTISSNSDLNKLNDLYSNHSMIKELTIKNGITTIVDGDLLEPIRFFAFAYSFFPSGGTASKEGLIVNLPSSLEYIGKRAFSGASIKEINIPANVKEIGNFAFSGNEYLSNLIFVGANNDTSKLKIIGDSAFSFNAIENLDIPASVETIGEDAFNCNNLKTVNFKSNSKLTTINKGAFAGDSCGGTMTKQNKLYYTYNNTNKLFIPQSVTYIGYDAFFGLNINSINFSGNSSAFDQDWCSK